MDRTRKANREDDEKTLQYRTQNAALQEAELAEEKLTQLQATVVQLEQTPQGLAELQRRTKLFGECKRLADESSAQLLRAVENGGAGPSRGRLNLAARTSVTL